MSIAARITVSELREQLGGITSDQRFVDYVHDDMFQDIIDRHYAGAEEKARRSVERGVVDPESLRHLAERVQVNMVAEQLVTAGDFPAGYIRYPYSAEDDGGVELPYSDDLRFRSRMSVFSPHYYRVIGDRIEMVPMGSTVINITIVSIANATNALLAGGPDNPVGNYEGYNIKIIQEAARMVESRISYSKHVAGLSDLEPE